MSLFSKILKQTGWQILGKAATSVSTFIILGVVARKYGPDGTGTFTLALTYLGLFFMLSDFGFNAHVLKAEKIEFQKLLGTRIIWSAALMMLAILMLPLWPFTTADFAKASVIAGAAIIASAVFVTCNLVFQSRLRYDFSVLASVFGVAAGLPVFLFLSLKNYPVPYLLFGYLVSWIVISLTALFFVRKFNQQISAKFDFGYALDLLKNSWPIAATLSLNVLYFRADSFLIAHFKSFSDVGIYNVAYSVFQSALVLPTFIMNAYYPLMLKSFDKAKLVCLGLLGIAVLGTLLTLGLAPVIVRFLTGGGFEGSVESLQILSLGFPAYFVSSFLMWFLIAKNKYKTMLLLYTSGLVVNIFLNLIYIPQYSFIAASWITVISEYFILVLQLMVLFPKR